MKRLLFRHATFAAFLILFAAAPRASAVLITYFNFNDSNLTSDAPGAQPSTITLPTPTGVIPSFVNGTPVNVFQPPPDPTGGLALRLTNRNNGGGNDKIFQFSVSTVGLTNLSLSYATQVSVTTFTQTLKYSIDGGATFVTVGTFTTTTANTWVVANFPNISSAVNGQLSVIFRIELTQPFGLKGDYNDFDNIQLNTAAIPEPATVTGGALALAAIGYMQRRRLRRLLPAGRRKQNR